MRFIVDAQLPPALARWIVANGHKAEHVGDRQMAAAPYAAIWELALHTTAAIITKDEDFAQRKLLTGAGPAIIWVRLPNTRRRALIAWFETMFPYMLSALERGETLIEVV
jgi:predicted nuclease of predicted toxin-antitoxin system